MFNKSAVDSTRDSMSARAAMLVNCDDEKPCTIDSCDANGDCTNTSKLDTATPDGCDDQDECTTDSCDPTDGECKHAAIPDCPA